ncbi:MAG TPA: DUF72 domain-containing protein [Candidatus Eremiobacteraceae bacterium]
MIRVGTCGFSYREWVGPFYPRGLVQTDYISYYAQIFDAVEIDSTYYAVPAPSMFERLDRRTPAGFRFTVKAPGGVTHSPAGTTPDEDEAQRFLASLESIRASGKLAAVLAQFPNGFRPSPDAFRRLDWLRRAWPDIAIVVEFRHRDWQRPETLRRLLALGLGWCNVDEPAQSSLLRPDAQTTSRIGYIRFHGRNAATWWNHEKPADRYAYLYSAAELEEWLPRIEQVVDKTDETFVFFNNHANGQATVNARQMAGMLHVAKLAPEIGAPRGPDQAPDDDPRLKLFD